MWVTSQFRFSKGHSESWEALGKYLWTDLQGPQVSATP